MGEAYELSADDTDRTAFGVLCFPAKRSCLANPFDAEYTLHNTLLRFFQFSTAFFRMNGFFSGFLAGFVVFAVGAEAAVRPSPLPPGYPQAKGLTVTVDGVAVPVLRLELNRRHREAFEVAAFTFDGTARIAVKADKPCADAVLRPAGYGIRTEAAGDALRFALDRPRHLVLRIPGRDPLLVFADGPAALPEPTAGPNTFDVVTRYRADPTGRTESTAAIQGAIDAATVRGGTVLLPPGTFVARKLTLRNDVRLHLAAGAALKFVDRIDEGFDFTKDHPGLYFIGTDGTRNIAVTGRGLIDCNGETLQSSDRKRKLISAFRSSQVEGLTIDGVTITDASSWTLVPAFSRRVLIRNVKIVNTLFLYENDGVDPIGCQDVLVDHCFVVATDDAFCPKPGGVGTHGGGVKPGPALALRDVVFNDCVAWTRAAAFKLGRQSSVPALNVTFRNSTVLGSSRACAIDHDSGSAPFRNILFQDIALESDQKSFPVSIEMLSPGPVSGVTYERLAVNLEKTPGSRLGGANATNRVCDVRFIDCTVQGRPVTGAGAPLRVGLNKFVDEVRFIWREPAKRGPAATLTAVWGAHRVAADAGAPVPVRPAVRVTDPENRPLAGVEVVFAVENGGGSVMQGTTRSDARGIAAAGGWVLGRQPGVNTLLARCPASPGSSVVFMTTGQSGGKK